MIISGGMAFTFKKTLNNMAVRCLVLGFPFLAAFNEADCRLEAHSLMKKALDFARRL